jgi:hypothetical protein
MVNRVKHLRCLGMKELLIHGRILCHTELLCQAGARIRKLPSAHTAVDDPVGDVIGLPGVSLPSAPTWHTPALESVPLSGIVPARDHAGHDSDRR